MYIFKKSLIAVVLTTASIVPAIANASSTTAVLIDSGSQTTELNYSAALPTFNAALGALTGVTIYETAEISIGAGSSVTNNDSSPKNFTFKEALNFTFSTGNSALDTFLLNPNLDSGSLEPTKSQIFTAIAPGASSSFGPFSKQVNSGNLFTSDSAILAAFSQSLILNISTLATTTLAISGSGNIANTLNTTGRGTFSVVFDYTPTPTAVPLPGAVWLFGSGLLGLAGMKRRAKAV